MLCLKAELPKIVDVILVNNSHCNHLDFLFSLKVTEHVNDPIKEILRMTDDPGWVYSGPSPRTIRKDPEEWSPGPVTDPNVVSISNHLAKNSDVIKHFQMGAENTNSSSVRLHDRIRQVDRK